MDVPSATDGQDLLRWAPAPASSLRGVTPPLEAQPQQLLPDIDFFSNSPAPDGAYAVIPAAAIPDGTNMAEAAAAALTADVFNDGNVSSGDLDILKLAEEWTGKDSGEIMDDLPVNWILNGGPDWPLAIINGWLDTAAQQQQQQIRVRDTAVVANNSDQPYGGSNSGNAANLTVAPPYGISPGAPAAVGVSPMAAPLPAPSENQLWRLYIGPNHHMTDNTGHVSEGHQAAADGGLSPHPPYLLEYPTPAARQALMALPPSGLVVPAAPHPAQVPLLETAPHPPIMLPLEAASLYGAPAVATVAFPVLDYEEQAQNEEMRLRLLHHPRMRELVSVVAACKKMPQAESESPDDSKDIDKIRDAALSDLDKLRALVLRDFNGGAPRIPEPDPELDAFVDKFIALCHSYQAEVAEVAKSAEALLQDFETKLSTTLQRSKVGIDPEPEEEAAPQSNKEERAPSRSSTGSSDGGTVSDDEPMELGTILKRKYSAQVQKLQEEFSKRKKVGKLPEEATNVLKEWWTANLAWPYPTDEVKKQLATASNLNATQINNWFINQRKRHWHKFFNGHQPSSREEAEATLRKLKVIP